MKKPILVFNAACLSVACLTLSAQDSLASRMLDPKLNIAQRNDACYEMRGARSPEAIAALAHALESPQVRACAARHLREAGAIDELKTALAGDDPEVRAAAARELGAIAKPELMDLLAQTARDPNLMVASNAFEGLTFYRDRAVLPYLLDLAAGGGPVAAMALSRAVEFADPGVLPVARRMMATKDVPLRLAALRAIGDLGNSSDLPALRTLAAKAENATPGGRGFGLMPALDLSRAAQNAIRQIEQRM
jgi:HEAT repeat protein